MNERNENKNGHERGSRSQNISFFGFGNANSSLTFKLTINCTPTLRETFITSTSCMMPSNLSGKKNWNIKFFKNDAPKCFFHTCASDQYGLICATLLWRLIKRSGSEFTVFINVLNDRWSRQWRFRMKTENSVEYSKGFIWPLYRLGCWCDRYAWMLVCRESVCISRTLSRQLSLNLLPNCPYSMFGSVLWHQSHSW